MTKRSIEDLLADKNQLAWMLSTRPLFTVDKLRELGGNSDAEHTLRLDTHDGPMFPAFQYDERGQLLPVVAELNRELRVDEDPLGAADWWLGGYTYNEPDRVNADLATTSPDLLRSRLKDLENDGF
jgi:hypothetical protein